MNLSSIFFGIRVLPGASRGIYGLEKLYNGTGALGIFFAEKMGEVAG
jgi:hypothetical protein